MDHTLDYKKSFRDICQGYTIINCSFGELYFKHINVSDQVLLDESKEDYIKEAKDRGISIHIPRKRGKTLHFYIRY